MPQHSVVAQERIAWIYEGGRSIVLKEEMGYPSGEVPDFPVRSNVSLLYVVSPLADVDLSIRPVNNQNSSSAALTVIVITLLIICIWSLSISNLLL